MTESWRPEEWENLFLTIDHDYKAFELGADAMHEADVKWLIERIIHDDRGYMFKMSDKEWQEFINAR